MLKIILLTLIGFNILFANSIKFNPQYEFSDGYRIVVSPEIIDDFGIYDARVYFKSKNRALYQFFTPLECKKDKCTGYIPITSKGTKAINYQIVYQNNGGKIYKSDEYTIHKKDLIELPKWQTFNMDRLDIYTEMNKVPKLIYGFDDKARLSKIDDNAKIGVLAKITNLEASGIENIDIIDGKFESIMDLENAYDNIDEEKSSKTTFSDVMLMMVALTLLL